MTGRGGSQTVWPGRPGGSGGEGGPGAALRFFAGLIASMVAVKQLLSRGLSDSLPHRADRCVYVCVDPDSETSKTQTTTGVAVPIHHTAATCLNMPQFEYEFLDDGIGMGIVHHVFVCVFMCVFMCVNNTTQSLPNQSLEMERPGDLSVSQSRTQTFREIFVS